MTLKQTISSMLARADKSPARVRLPHRLTIAIMVDGDVCHLQLSRPDVYPALLEWRTVLQQWPGQYVVIQEPRPIRGSAEYYLKGKIRLMPELFQ